MHTIENLDSQIIARTTGWCLSGTIVLGIFTAMFVSQGIDVNMSGDIVATAENMLNAEVRLRAKAYLGLLIFSLEVLINFGLFLLLRKFGLLLAGWSLLVSLAASVVILLGAVFAMNVAYIAGNEAFTTVTDINDRLMLSSLQATSDHTSFHLGLIISAAGKAGFFYLFIKSGLIPKLISGWGLFASLFVVITIVARDFIPILGHNSITAAFILSNLIAILSLGVYLGFKGIKAGR